MPSSTPYRFRFFRAGAVDQVDISDEGALANLHTLDQKLWLALACPVDGLELDPRSLEMIDTGHDRRIRPPELLAAVAWVNEVFVNLKGFFDGKDELALASLSEKTALGRMVRDSAKRILVNLGRPEAKTIRLEDVTSTEKIFEQTTLNGDGIVPVDAAADAPTRALVEDVMQVMGSVRDRSGKPGIDQAKSDAFFVQAGTFAEWLQKAESDPVRPIGAATGPAFDAFLAVRSKVDDYFMRVRLSAFDARFGSALEASAEDLQALSAVDLTSSDPRVGRWPLAHVAPGRALSLRDGQNPAWTEKMDAFAKATVDPLLGPGHASLTEAEWVGMKARLAPYEAWLGKKPDLAIAALGNDRVRALASGEAQKKVNDLIVQDAALEGECSSIEAVEKAIRMQRDLVPLVRNFVSFADFYGKRRGIFQIGTLYIDGRSCDLCLPVHDAAKHATLAALAKAYLLYCDCTRKKDGGKIAIVAAVTAGDVDNLLVGRNGIFYDRKGDDWDATVTKLVENPVSVRQAFWSPYKRFIRAIEMQVAKRAAAAETKTNQGMETHAVKLASAEPEKPADVPKPEAKTIDVGTVAAIGVAVGGIATFFSSILATFFGLGMWMPLGLLALLLAISGPSMLIAWLKLSQRNIGPILDANGWAVNAFARINVPFGAALTQPAALPAGARRILDDPFEEKKKPYRAYLVAVLLVALVLTWTIGKLDRFLPEQARTSHLLYRAPPDANGPAPSVPSAPAAPLPKP
jgi:hypothetical protein